MSFKVKLTKLESNHNNLRTDVVEGTCRSLPVVGRSFGLASSPLIEGMLLRVVTTSPVEKVTKEADGVLLMKTRNSTYRVEFEELMEKSA